MDAVAIYSNFPEGDEQGNREPIIEWPNIRQRRILIYGVTGSGKTTMAAWLSEKTGIPWTEIDLLMWNPGWELVPVDLQRERVAEICARDEWILDAAYAPWLDIPLERVQLIIGLDYSRSRTFWQLLKRTVTRAIDKKEVCNQNVETFKGMFSRDSILIWHFKSFARKRERMRLWQADQANFDVILLKRPTSPEKWEMERIMERIVENLLEREDEF